MRDVRSRVEGGADRHHPDRLGDACVELQRAERHRAVDVYGHNRDAARVFEPLQPVEHLFHATDGKRRNDQPSAAGRDVGHDPRQTLPIVVGS